MHEVEFVDSSALRSFALRASFAPMFQRIAASVYVHPMFPLSALRFDSFLGTSHCVVSRKWGYL